MVFLVNFSRKCPFCMAVHKQIFNSLASPYIFRINLNFSYDHLALTEITPKEPLFYHPATNTYIVGAPTDPKLIRELLSFLVDYDFEMTLFKKDKLPVPEHPLLVDHYISSFTNLVADTIYKHAGYASIKTKDSVYDAELSVAERISILLENL